MRYYSRVGPRASTCEKVFFSTFSLSGFFDLERNWIWLASVRRWAVRAGLSTISSYNSMSALFSIMTEHYRWKDKRKTLYNFNSVQLTFNQCVFNRIQYRTEHNLYSTRFDNVDKMKSSTRRVQLNTVWRMEIQHRLYIMKNCSFHFSLFRKWKVETIRAFEYSCRRPSVGLSDDLGR